MATGFDGQVLMLEVNENDVNCSVMLPRVNIYARGKVIIRKKDASEDSVVRRNDNNMLDTRKYRVDFDDAEVRKLTENVIAESIYAACDDSGKD